MRCLSLLCSCVSIILLTFFTVPCFNLYFAAHFFIFFQLPSTVLYACRAIKKLCCYVLMLRYGVEVTSLWSSGAKDEWRKCAMPSSCKQVDSTTLRDFWLASNYFTMRFFSFSLRSPIFCVVFFSSLGNE